MSGSHASEGTLRAHDRAFLRELRSEIRARGWHRPATGRVLGELGGHVSLALSGAAVFFLATGPWGSAAGLLLSTAGTMGVATNTHTSSHHATSRRPWVNEALTYFGCAVFLGLSATYWRCKHVDSHHVAPNVLGIDEDINLAPWFALTRCQVEASKGLRRLYYRWLQAWVFLLALSLNVFQMQKNGCLHVVRHLRDPRRRRRAHWIDLACLAAHPFLTIALPLALFPAGDVATFAVLRFALLGYAMFAVFAPAHLPAEAQFSRAPAAGFIERQTTTTLDYRAGVLGVFCGGLQYQIEHHLAPEVSHVHYPAMRERVETLCRSYGFPYRRYGWGEGVRKSFAVLRQPKAVGPAPEARR